MADTKISALTELAQGGIADADEFAVNDGGAETKRYTWLSLLTDVLAYISSATKTLTNTTIDADGTGNSISNIENADIKASAGIAVNKLAALTASEIAITDASGFLASAAVATYPSLTELSYVKGVTSAIQTQIGAKAPTASPTFTGTVTLPVGLTGVIRADSGVVSVDTDVTDIVAAGTESAAGKLELATDAETVTGTDTARAVTPANVTAKMAAPGAIGGTTPSTGKFTTVETTGNIELGHASDTTIARVSAGVASIEGSNILTAATGLPLAGGTMTGSITLGENASIALDPAGSADGKWTGLSVTGTSGYTQSFGDVVYLDPTDSRWEAADANSASGADGDARGPLGIVVSTGTDGNSCTILLVGIIRADAKFPAMTIGAPMYVSETAGSIVGTKPTTTDAVVRCVGFALTADELYFNPSSDYGTAV